MVPEARHDRPWTGRLTAPAPLLGPLFAALDEVLRGRLPARWPDVEALNAALAGPIERATGRALRFVPASAHGQGARAYEAAVRDDGAIATRADSWHDLFNALAWYLFPQSKAAINRAHLREGSTSGSGNGRSPRRDALTLLDEAGLVLAVTDPRFEALNRAHRWEPLFVGERAAWGRTIHPVVFGHGLLDQCLAPHRGLTAKAIYLAVPPAFGALPAVRRFALLDGWLAARIATLASPRCLLPLPVLGIPGCDPANADPAYYRDRDTFRPRRERPAPRLSPAAR